MTPKHLARIRIISPIQAVDILQHLYDNDYSGFFRVVFIKRTTGEKRVMSCRFSRKDNGGSMSYDIGEKRVLPVVDTVLSRLNRLAGKEKAWRNINLDAILEFTVNHERYIVDA